MLAQIISDTELFRREDNIATYKSYLQIKPGGYGYGDQTWAVRIPELRQLSKKYKHAPIEDVLNILTNPVHDLRMLALFILDLKYNRKGVSVKEKEMIVNSYLANLQYVNNWDLVDASSYKILGPFVFNTNQSDILIGLANSSNLWENRVAMISTFYHIRQHEFELALKIAKQLLAHKHDIIHKAIGWMLREIGNRDQIVEIDFLRTHYKNMPRTALRYAIEKFDEPLRQAFLQGKV